MDKFRIHGDNIVECEKILNVFKRVINPTKFEYSLKSPAVINYYVEFNFKESDIKCEFDLIPGFNKSRRQRWKKNIFDVLKNNGSFLNETPDAIISKVNDNESEEKILCAVEFCSALQAGNQAWQRSGRAFSTGLSGCDYLYIIDFVKYELNPDTRERISLRFPNPIVPFSYVTFSNNNNIFVTQSYFKSEEFDKTADAYLSTFDENDFSEEDVSNYLIKKLFGFDTKVEQNNIIRKNLNIVYFLSRPQTSNAELKSSKSIKCFSESDWKNINNNKNDIVDYSISKKYFKFSKKISSKSLGGHNKKFLEIVSKYSVGLASPSLPIGIIPKEHRKEFADAISNLYLNSDKKIISKISKNDKNLILCIIKGFKPKGDDNRPDRGILPLVSMLSSDTCEVMTFIYGPILQKNYNLLIKSPSSLVLSNGLWNSVIGLSNYVLLDSPLINSTKESRAEILIDTNCFKHSSKKSFVGEMKQEYFSPIPTIYQEDDVDTALHYTFSHLLQKYCFEGMCNPPGGDWSGMSLIDKGTEKRWLSLPRVSGNGKRPDHIIEFYDVADDGKVTILSIESKERSSDLENQVGLGLKYYISNLMNYVPSVEKTKNGEWKKSTVKVNSSLFEIISAAAFIKDSSTKIQEIYQNSQCDMLIILSVRSNGWLFEIDARTKSALQLKNYIISKLNSEGIANSICVI